ncbi:hypothetical protein N0V90_011866 [Kalmusia sp. IMI 367209]|nr:hypothetical protein N0V90_011866 [Kalmusia sp. IMI 367209]
MPTTDSSISRKRGRPPKYDSAKEKKAANAHRRRAQRQGKAASGQEVQTEAYQAEGPGYSVFFWPTSVHLDLDMPSTLGSGVDTGQTSLEGTVQYGDQDLEAFLPPLGPSDSLLLEPISTRVDDTFHQSTTPNRTIAGARGQEEAELESIEIISDEITDFNIMDVASIAISNLKKSRRKNHPNHIGLEKYLDRVEEEVVCPDVLGSKAMTTHESNFASQMSEASRRYLYCRVRNDDISPDHICLKADDVASVDTEVTFDIDSVLGFPSSLAIAKQGICWNPTQMAVSDLQSDLHLNSRLAHYVDRHGHAHSVSRPLHQLPHYTFKRLVGFEDISLYLVFPHLYREEQQAIERPGLQHFRGVFLFCHSKILKCLTKDSTWRDMTSCFDEYWTKAVVENYMTSDAYIDVGKELCPAQGSSIRREEMDDGEHKGVAKTLLWKRCCLDTYNEWMRGKVSDRHQRTFYPFSMLHDSGSMTIETHRSSKSRAGGLLYSQFYSSIKEMFAAGNAYSFTNAAIETLALGPKLRKTWQHVGAGLSHDPVALIRAYLYTKLRRHYTIYGSTQKCFGTREEHRVSKKLFSQIDARIQQRRLDTLRFRSAQDSNRSYYILTTSTMLKWLRWNINKLCVGFEMVYGLKDRHFVT